MTQYCIYCGAKLQESQKFCMRCGKKVLTDEELESLEVSETESPKEPKLMVFISYATKDVNLYKIRNIAEKLSEFDEIDDVLYWQEDMHDNIYKYMNDNLGKCDVVLLFCSANALSSIPVEKEWTAADSLGKPIIPIFINSDDIPPLLSSRLGVEFDAVNFHETIQELYDIIIKKTIENVELKSQLKHARKERNYLIILSAILVIGVISLLVLKNQIGISLNEYILMLFIVGIAVMGLSLYLLYFNLRMLIDAIIARGKIAKFTILYLLSTFLIIVTMYFLINRSYYFGNFFMLIFLYTPISAFLLFIISLMIAKKTRFKELKRILKVGIIISIVFCFFFPLYLGIGAPVNDPNVEMSPQPLEIYYEFGNQVQEVKEFSITLKAFESNARNVFIDIIAPQNISYWVDGFLNGSKSIPLLEFDSVIRILIEIQPLSSVGDGDYTIGINLSYESGLGTVYQKYSSISVLIGTITPGPIAISGYPILITILLMVVVISVISWKLIFIVQTKRRRD